MASSLFPTARPLLNIGILDDGRASSCLTSGTQARKTHRVLSYQDPVASMPNMGIVVIAEDAPLPRSAIWPPLAPDHSWTMFRCPGQSSSFVDGIHPLLVAHLTLPSFRALIRLCLFAFWHRASTVAAGVHRPMVESCAPRAMRATGSLMQEARIALRRPLVWDAKSMKISLKKRMFELFRYSFVFD